MWGLVGVDGFLLNGLLYFLLVEKQVILVAIGGQIIKIQFGRFLFWRNGKIPGEFSLMGFNGLICFEIPENVGRYRGSIL